MSEIKCCKCGKKLAEAELQNGTVSIKCKCGTMNTITAWVEESATMDQRSYTDRLSKKLEKK